MHIGSTLKNYPGTGLASCPVHDSIPTIRHDPCTKCTFCKTYWKQVSVFKSLVTFCTFSIPSKDIATCLTCNSKNVIYLITCKKCEVQYVGLTTQKLRIELVNILDILKRMILLLFLLLTLIILITMSVILK